jgi:hypothetical protein
MLFIYVARRFGGEVKPDLREGELAWVDLETYYRDLPIPQADRVFAPQILESAAGMFEAKFLYDSSLSLLDCVIY